VRERLVAADEPLDPAKLEENVAPALIARHLSERTSQKRTAASGADRSIPTSRCGD
jgi:hypothetical protein